MSHNPNTVKSQDDLPTTNDGRRSSDVLLSTIEELEKTKKQLECGINRELLFLKKIERLEKQLEIAVKALKDYAESDNWELENEKYIYWTKKRLHYPWRLGGKALKEIEELNK